jgi:hypothetical protein
LKAANGEIVAIGESYASKEGCICGIETVKKNAPLAKIVELKRRSKNHNLSTKIHRSIRKKRFFNLFLFK